MMSSERKNPMRPSSLAEGVERIQIGVSRDVALAEFVDTFDLGPTDEARYATIAEEPALTGDKRLDALRVRVQEYFHRGTAAATGPRSSPVKT
jgi:hypothetical protein